MTLDSTQENENTLIVSSSPFYPLMGIVFTLSAWYAFSDSLMSLPSGDEDWGVLFYGVMGSIIFPLSVVQTITRKTVFSPSKIYDKKFYKLTVEKDISDIARLEKLNGNRLCFRFVDGTRITIDCHQRNVSEAIAFISNHSDGRVTVSKT